LRFLHLSDLHLGQRLCEFSMLEEQRYILEEILTLLDETLWTACCWAATFTTSPFPLPKRYGCWTGF
jgi:DNA repair exonuclease